MKFKHFLLPMFPVGLFAAGVQAATPTIDLNGIGYVQYGDALSYSMPFAQFQVSGSTTPNPGDRFYIESTPGAIQDLVVVATGSSGGPVTTNFKGMDDAYATPSGVGGENFFLTGGLTFPTGTYDNKNNEIINTYPALDPGQVAPFFGDRNQANTWNSLTQVFTNNSTWDATLASMQTFLDGSQMVFFFNNNQLNQTDSEQSLAIWAQAWITDANGNVFDPDGIGGPETGYFDVTNNNSPYALFTEGGGGVPLGSPLNYTNITGKTNPDYNATTGTTDYILSGGGVCLTAGGAPVACSNPLAVIGPVNHNLGANNAAYAVVLPELNALMGALFTAATKPNSGIDLTQYTMHLDIRMGCDPILFGSDSTADICDGGSNYWGKNLNNGYEQIFIGRAEGTYQVPEPATLMLLGMGLFGLGMARRRKG